jgi:hypothetical protein
MSTDCSTSPLGWRARIGEINRVEHTGKVECDCENHSVTIPLVGANPESYSSSLDSTRFVMP